MRHPQSYKNLRDEHGGKGSDLTEQGIEDAKLATQKIKQASFKKVIGTPSIQVISALEVMKKFMNPEIFSINSQLKGLDFGVLAGLSNDRAKKEYPQIYQSMKNWRDGEGTIEELTIENAESVRDFHSRINTTFNEIIKQNESIVIVCTTSVFIMCFNILLMWGCFNFSAYRNIEIPLANFAHFKKQQNFTLLDYYGSLQNFMED